MKSMLDKSLFVNNARFDAGTKLFEANELMIAEDVWKVFP